ncbi:MAG: hypothetical protein GY749_23995 [Desulfobacteraceae bacterium]|nr:hypothetical protein [Desulfobacteraceae bacterium]
MTHTILAEIAQGEDQHREFKQIIDNPERIAGEIVAFANSNGGTLYIGVDDNGTITGLDDINVSFQSVTNICRDRCIPPVSPVINQHTIQSRDILAVTIMPELNRAKPYRTAGGRFYIRAGRDKKDATGRELIRIAQAAGELHYDESLVSGTNIADLSLSAFSHFHQVQFGMTLDEHIEQSNMTLPALLRNLRLAHDLDGELVLSTACILVFGKTPEQFMPHSRVSAVAFAGNNEDSDILDRREISGRLPVIINETKAFLERNIRVPAREHGFSREDIMLYDRKALGEAVVNAIAHRDYSLSGSQIRLFLFQDRIEVRSPGCLPNSVTLENIRLGVHTERNRAIVRLLTQMGYMSAIGTGIPRMIIRLTRSLSGREPEFELVGEELRVRIWAKL